MTRRHAPPGYTRGSAHSVVVDWVLWTAGLVVAIGVLAGGYAVVLSAIG